MPDPPVFIFNTHYNGLGVIRAYGRAGIPVVAMDTHRSVGAFSRYAKYRSCPDPGCREKAFIDFLLETRREYTLDPFLFPTNDHWAMAVARHKETLRPFFHVMTPDYERLRNVIDKKRFYRFAEDHAFDAPRTYNTNALLKRTERVQFPVVAKPLARRISSNDPVQKENQVLFDRLRLTRIENDAELEFFLANHPVENRFLFQEEIQGGADRMYTVGVYADRTSDALAIFTGRKVRGDNPLYGDCIVGQVERVPSELVRESRRLVKELGFTGIAEVEFKKDARDDRFRLIEINPRSWSWIGITPYCDVNLPIIAYEDMVKEKKIYAVSKRKTGSVKWMRVMDDFSNCMWRYRKNGFPEASMGLAPWISSTFKGSKVIMEDCSLVDPLPSIWGIYRFIKNRAFTAVGALLRTCKSKTRGPGR